MSERTLLLGYDLGDHRTRMSVYDLEKMEPVPIGQGEDETDIYVPTEIKLEGMPLMDDFLSRIRRGEDIIVGDKTSRPDRVLAYFFRKTLPLTRQQYPGETIKQLVVTVRDAKKEIVELLYEALEQLGIGRDRALVLDHKQAFLYYVLYQKKEIWINDVGIFDCTSDGLRYAQMHIDRTTTPILVGVAQKDYSDSVDLTSQSEEHKRAVFENVVYGAIHRQLLSTLYMTGDGFEEGWAEPVFHKLCVGRRLFKGNNLYVSGACYAAKEVSGGDKLSGYLLMDEEMITSRLSISVYADGKDCEETLTDAGEPWYMVDREISLIPDGETEITLLAEDVFDHRQRRFILDLEPVATRVDRQCRLTLRARFASPTRCIITMKDEGFGDLYPSSHRIWEKTFDIGGSL